VSRLDEEKGAHRGERDGNASALQNAPDKDADDGDDAERQNRPDELDADQGENEPGIRVSQQPRCLPPPPHVATMPGRPHPCSKFVAPHR